MKMLAAFVLLIWSFVAFSQEVLDVQFLMTQRTQSNPLALPIRVNAQGEVSYFGGNGSETLNFRPTIQLGFSRATINYSQPVILNRFNFYPQQNDLGWVEVKRLRLEAGMGIATLIQQSTTVGLMPYKGAMHTIIRFKNSRDDKSLPFRMPKELSELEEWNTNDQGSFQMYGGITAYAGFSMGIVDVALGSVGFQNQFIVEMTKVDENTVKLGIAEEDLKRRQIIVGANVIEGTFAQFKGKRFCSEFILNLNEPEHHELFKAALNGNIQYVQERLESKKQKLSWNGRDSSYYAGIPLLIGKMKDAGHYDLNEDGRESELDFTGSRSKGILTPLRNFQDFVYQTDKAMMIVWSSEMNKTSKSIFEKRFLSIGRTIGIKGFKREIPGNTKFGSVVSQVAVHVSKKEIEAVKDINMEEVRTHLKAKCEEEKLKCRTNKRLTKIINELTELLKEPWDKMNGKLGLLIIKEPAVIHAVVKTMKYKKEVYFKFLSEKFQSLEGSSAIEI